MFCDDETPSVDTLFQPNGTSARWVLVLIEDHMETISLFPQGACDPVDRKADKAIAAIVALFAARHPVVVAYSGGKDSSVVAALVLHAALLHHSAGGKPMVVVTTGDTLVESPEVAQHYRAELRRMRAFGKAHGITVSAHIVTPSLASTFQVKVLSGRALPSFPGAQGDCSTDLKIGPQRSFRRRLFRELEQQGLAEPVTCLGSRYDESTRRAAGMRLRGDTDITASRNKDGDLVISPVAHWSDDDIWEAVGCMQAMRDLGTRISKKCGGSMPIPSGLRVLSWLMRYWTVAVPGGKANVVRAWAVTSARWPRTRASQTWWRTTTGTRMPQACKS
ncbi:hypothetical protein ACTMU2_35860 (plasmid) [Cupriavidus basilensis]